MLRRRNFWVLLLSDAVLIVLAHYLSYWARFEGRVPPDQLAVCLWALTWLLPLKLFLLGFFDLYKGIWRYTSLHDLLNLVKACAAATVLSLVAIGIFIQFQGVSRGVFFMDFCLTLLLLGGLRVGIRVFFARESGPIRFMVSPREKCEVKKVLIIGAGSMGEKLIREIRENPKLRLDVVGLIDDDPAKMKQTIHGVPVLGDVAALGEAARKHGVQELIIAIALISGFQMRRIVAFCEATGLPFKTMPAMGDLVEGKISAIRQVRYEDLLGREPVDLNIEEIGQYLTGKRVMVTGGAGSIGSELCRQIRRFNPETLAIADRNESGLYELNLALKEGYPDLRTVEALCAVQNEELMERVFEKLRPEVIFHAAAYKHVPMMELNPWEAVFNNIVGVNNILRLCRKHDVGRCVLVSTDKAVRPTNVMGASKRVGEILMQAHASGNGVPIRTKFMAVRFGNVVGSAGSVIPLFQKQIERGGPVTVTHPDVTRFFMTIPEACSLILQAGALGRGGEIFVLKMGVPVKIADMARDIITLHGLKPEEDIEIKYIGLRPGEKLYEELITGGEDVAETRHSDIMVINSHLSRSLGDLNGSVDALIDAARSGDASNIKKCLKKIVPEYVPAK
ncbi:MAG: nucleoside-diphosphate sugar epimerase/dehydratase [Pseudomonadota bacterium]